MNCEALAEIILDMARGTAVPEAARLEVRRHMETCGSCAAEHARQRDLTTALQALAAEAQEWKAPAAMEQRLLAAFATQEGHEPAVVNRPSSNRWRYVLASAAVMTLAVWGIREASRQEPQRPPTSERPVKAGAPVAAENSVAAASADGGVKAQEFPKSPADKPKSHRPANPQPANPQPANPRPATPVEFVRIPSAIGLPELESGTVLRMELPLTSLPEYGLDIAPDAVRTSVEADILVGQDGQPRAIRLIGRPETVAQDPRSRQ